MITTCFAPASFAAITQQSPRWPAPRITTRWPGAVFGIETAHESPAASGLNMTATPAVIFGFTFFITEWGDRYICSAYPPQRCGAVFTSV